MHRFFVLSVFVISVFVSHSMVVADNAPAQSPTTYWKPLPPPTSQSIPPKTSPTVSPHISPVEPPQTPTIKPPAIPRPAHSPKKSPVITSPTPTPQPGHSPKTSPIMTPPPATTPTKSFSPAQPPSLKTTPPRKILSPAQPPSLETPPPMISSPVITPIVSPPAVYSPEIAPTPMIFDGIPSSTATPAETPGVFPSKGIPVSFAPEVAQSPNGNHSGSISLYASRIILSGLLVIGSTFVF